MLGAFRRWLGGRRDGEVAAASQLPPVEDPKVKPKQQSIPSYITNTRSDQSRPLPRTDRNLANTDILTFRSSSTDSRLVLRSLIKATPDLSAAVFTYLRVAISSRYTAVSRNMDGTFNREATLLLQQLLVRFDTVQDYSDGFSGIWSLRSLSEALGKEMLNYGAFSFELVLGKDRLPRTLSPVSVTQVQFKPDDRWLAPIQKIGQEEIDLDYPTFFYVALDQDLLEPYADPPFEAAIQAVLADSDFFNDLRRLVKRALHPRVDVKIDQEKFRQTIPQEIAFDPNKMAEYTKNVLAQIEEKFNDLAPEDALVHFDFIEVSFLNHGTNSPASEEETLQNLARSRVSAGAKTLPSVLGHGGGTQNVASTESMLFVKSVAGAVQEKLNEGFSKALTLALRLFGLDVYVEFKYEPINLRPEDELEAFYAMRQSRILEQLSLGLITDDEACIRLTGSVTPAGFTSLQGTGFAGMKGAAVNDAPYSSTGSAGDKQGPLNQGLKPDTPQNKKSDKGSGK